MATHALDELASFLKDFEDSDFKAGAWTPTEDANGAAHQWPYVSYHLSVNRFMEAAYEHEWIMSHFDWAEWSQSDEAVRLRDDPVSLSSASMLDLFRLLTVCIRQEKFSDGAVLEAFDSGLIPRIVRRAAAIVKNETDATQRKLLSYRTYIAASRTAYIAGIEAGISPQELRAHTGVIGEAFVADHLGVKLSAITNQHGYDLMDPDGLRVSVKTITTSNHVSLNEKTLHQVDRIIVVWLGTEADELDVVIVYDKSVDEFVAKSQPYQGKLRLSRSAMNFPNKPVNIGVFDVGAVIDTHEEDSVIYRKHVSGSYTVLVGGKPQPAFQYFFRLRNALGLPTKSQDTTRTLGAQVFGRLKSASDEISKI